MGFYSTYILPKAIHFACGHKPLTFQRRKVVPLAKGRVLEIGMGSGLNLPFYDPGRVERVWGLDPDAKLLKMAEKSASNSRFEVDFLRFSGEEIPLEKNTADTILVTYTLCSIPGLIKALNEMQRVLRPGGELIFCEHGRAPDKNVRIWQKRLNPIWGFLSGGCRLDIPIPSVIEEGGFKIAHLETMYIPGFKPACFNYWGTAVQK